MKKYKLHFIRPQLFSADILATVSGCSTTEISSPNLLKDTTPGVVTFANPTQSAFGTTSKTKEQIEQALREGERARVAGVEARRAHRESASVLGALEAADNFERIAREDGQTSHQMSAWELQASLLILLDRFGEAKIKLAQKRDLTWSINNNLNALVFLKTGEIEKVRELFNPKKIYRNVKDVEDRPKLILMRSSRAHFGLLLH